MLNVKRRAFAGCGSLSLDYRVEGIKWSKCGVEAPHGPVLGKNLLPCRGKFVILQAEID